MNDIFEKYRRDKSSEAFERLVERYRPLVYSICRRYLRNPHDVDDAAQETFLKLAIHAGEVSGTITGWLTASAYSTSVDLIRRFRSEERRRHGLAVATPHAQHRVMHEAIQRRVNEALLHINGSSRELIIARFMKKQPLRVLAADADVTVGTMSRRVSAALGELADVLRHFGLDGIDDLTLAEHFGDSSYNAAEFDGRATETLRFAPDWNSPELIPQGLRGPVHLMRGWKRPIRVGVLVSYATLSMFSTQLGAYVPVFDQVRTTGKLPRGGVQLVGIVEPGTDGIGVVESTLRDYDLLGGLIQADDFDALATLDVILLGNNFSMDPHVAGAICRAVQGGVGLLNERWTANTSQVERDANLQKLMLADSPWFPYHTPGGCGKMQPATVLEEHALLPGLKRGTHMMVAGCSPAYRIAPGARVLISQDMKVGSEIHGINTLGDLSLPTFLIGELGRGRVVITQVWPPEKLDESIDAAPDAFFTGLLQWLAEPRRHADDAGATLAILSATGD